MSSKEAKAFQKRCRERMRDNLEGMKLPEFAKEIYKNIIK